jgi:hypothetical protein
VAPKRATPVAGEQAGRSKESEDRPGATGSDAETNNPERTRGRPLRPAPSLCRVASGVMRGIGCRLAVAGVLAVVLAAVLVQGSETSGDGRVDRDGQRAAAVVVGAAPTGGSLLVTRARTGVDGEVVSLSRLSKAELVAASLGLGLPSLAWGWWYLMRPDRRFASPSRRALLAALRAPPRLVVR